MSRKNRKQRLKQPLPARLEAAAPPAGEGVQITILAWVALSLLAFCVYLPTLKAGFIWDDDALTANPLLGSFTGLWRIWTAPHPMQEQHYWPLVYTTFWFEHLLSGLRPFLFHLDNILLHCAATLLLWRVLLLLELPGSWLAAALFAVHPVHAESVAWVIERKDVLSGAFFFGSALVFLKWADRDSVDRMDEMDGMDPGEGAGGRLAGGRSWFYILSLALFAAALLSKSVVVGLPVALGLALWLRGRLGWRNVLALLPFVLVAAGLTLADLMYFAGRQEQGLEQSGLTLAERVLMAGRAVWVYLFNLARPWGLATFYPKWTVNLHQPAAWLPLAGWLALLAGLWCARRRIGRGAFAGATFFTVMLAPALGVMDFDFLTFTWVADRFQYLASAGPLALAAAGIVGLARRRRWPAEFVRYGLAALLAVLVYFGFRQSALYHDSTTLFRAAANSYPQCWSAQTNLAWTLRQQGRGDEAMKVLEDALRRTPQHDPRLTLEMALTLDEQQRFPEAERYFQEALRNKPDFIECRFNYGAALIAHGNLDGAEAQYRAVLRQEPKNAVALHNLGNVLRQQRKLDEAAACLAQAVSLDPGTADYHVNYALVLQDQGTLPAALEQCRLALQINPDHFQAYHTTGEILLAQGKTVEAANALFQAMRVQPGAADTLFLLGNVHEQLNNNAEAIRCYRGVLQLKPDHAGATRRLAALGAAGGGAGRM